MKQVSNQILMRQRQLHTLEYDIIWLIKKS